MENPSQDQMLDMIEAIFARADQLLAANDLPPPGDQTGFTELLRLVFEGDEAGQAIFATMDSELLKVLFDMYQKRDSKPPTPIEH